MPRPQLKLPKKVSAPVQSPAPAPVEAESTTFVPPVALPSTGQGDTGRPPPGRHIDIVSATTAVNLPLATAELDEKTEEARLLLHAEKIRGRFRPLNMKYFAKYAKNLSRLTDERMSAARETLARIYGYRDLHELTGELSGPGHAGPFDDVLCDSEWDADVVQLALAVRWERAFEIIHERIPRLRYDANMLCSPSNIEKMSLFCTPQVHLSAVTALDLPPYISERASHRISSDDLATDEFPNRS